MSSIVVTGSSRGIGLGLIKVLLNSEKPWKHIIATCRNPDQALELLALAKQHGNLHVLKLDVTDYGSFANFVKQVSDIVKDDGLNVLLNNAGITARSARLDSIEAVDLTSVFETNTVAPLLLTKALLPLLKKASAVNASKKIGITRAAIINMSSILGSIGSDTYMMGPAYAYRMSKCALNAATKSMSVELKDDKILCLALHPGWVKTDMGSQQAPLTVETCTESIVRTLRQMSDSNNGTLVQYDGQQLPW